MNEPKILKTGFQGENLYALVELPRKYSLADMELWVIEHFSRPFPVTMPWIMIVRRGSEYLTAWYAPEYDMSHEFSENAWLDVPPEYVINITGAPFPRNWLSRLIDLL